MHELTKLIKDDMAVALGVTEPGAIAFCAARARSLIGGELIDLEVSMNSDMYKNAHTCCIPNSDAFGSAHAAALGYVTGDPDQGLSALSGATPEDDALAANYVRKGMVRTTLSGISSRIFIEACLRTSAGTAQVTIRDSHTSIVSMLVNGKTVFESAGEAPESAGEAQEGHRIYAYTLKALVDYVNTVPQEEIAFVKDAYRVNLELFEAGLHSPKTRFAKQLLAMNGGEVISRSERSTASLLCNHSFSLGLYSARYALWPMIISIVSIWIVQVGIGSILTVSARLGVVGLWIAQALDEWTRGIAVSYLWLSKRWIPRSDNR